MRLILVRHGQTFSNVGSHLDTARPGADLTRLGRRQAAALVPVLSRESIHALHVSTLARTHQTAQPLADHLGLVPRVHDGLREIAAGDLEMANDPHAVETYLATALRWIDGELDVRMPGGETGEEVLVRYDAAIAEVAADIAAAGTAVAVSHGAIIRVWSSLRCENLDGVTTARYALPNTGAVVLDGEPGSWRLAAWHDTPLGGEVLDAEDGPAGEPLG